MSKVAVVTGSNKGIGFAIVKGLCQKYDGVVYLTSRDTNKGKEALAKLYELGLNPRYHQLDVADSNSVWNFSDYIKKKYGQIEILINNAAVTDTDPFTCKYEDAKRVIDINYRSIFTLRELIFPVIRNGGRIVNISSNCGHLSNVKNVYWRERLSKKDLSEADVNEFVDWFLDSVKNATFDRNDFADDATVSAYRVAKVALSAITMVLQRALGSRNISINSMHPGIVKTDMTRGNGFYDTDQAANTPLYLALDAPQMLRGSYLWHDGTEVDWSDYSADYYFKISSLFE